MSGPSSISPYPIEAVTASSRPDVGTGAARKASSRRPAMSVALVWPPMPGASRMNSSPPQRATTSVRRKVRVRIAAVLRSTSSPTRWL